MTVSSQEPTGGKPLKETAEARAGRRIISALIDSTNIEVLSYHPTSSKAYETDLIRIPKRIGAARTKERYHVDIIAASPDTLWLIELKGQSAESDLDVKKLKEICNTYSVDELVDIILRRQTTSQSTLKEIRHIQMCLGVETHNAQIPPDVLVLCAPNDHDFKVCVNSENPFLLHLATSVFGKTQGDPP